MKNESSQDSGSSGLLGNWPNSMGALTKHLEGTAQREKDERSQSKSVGVLGICQDAIYDNRGLTIVTFACVGAVLGAVTVDTLLAIVSKTSAVDLIIGSLLGGAVGGVGGGAAGFFTHKAVEKNVIQNQQPSNLRLGDAVASFGDSAERYSQNRSNINSPSYQAMSK